MTSTAALILALLVLVLCKVLTRLWPTRSSPPGPAAYRFLAHLVRPRGKKTSELFYEWGTIYGDVINTRILGRSLVVLNSDATCQELLEKRGAIYSSRPTFAVLEQMGFEKMLTIMPYDKTFLQHRRVFDRLFTRRESLKFRPILRNEARNALKGLLSDTVRYERVFERFAVAIILKIVYSHDVLSDDDPYIELNERADSAANNAGSPGSTAIDFFPFLKYLPSSLPGTYYADWARKWHSTIREFYDRPFDMVNQRMVSGLAEPSILLNLLESKDTNGLTSEDMKGIAGTVCAAGTDTTNATLHVFLLLMVLHPDVQHKAQRELDNVIGRDDLPDFGARDKLPYIECIVQETLRWHPVVESGIPHLSTQGDVYRGMLIQKGSVVIANTRGISLDEEVYQDPRRFWPERFLPKPEGLGEPPCSAAFGYGRRICPGHNLALESVWIMATSILTLLDVSALLDEFNEPIMPVVRFSEGLGSHPEHFDCVIRLRSDTDDRLVRTIKG